MQRTMPRAPAKGSQLCRALGLGLLLHAGCAWTAPPAATRQPHARTPALAPDAACTREDAHAGNTQRATDDASVLGPARTLQAVSVMTWNLDWFQDPTEGPGDDAAQYAAVVEILESAGDAVIALQELSSEAAFERLLADLPAYAGVLSGYAWTQKTALLWRRDAFELLLSRAISGLDDAGRPPLEVRLASKADHRELVFVVLHAKAQADAESYARRVHLAEGIKAHLDTAHAHDECVVLGDFNDQLVGSITSGAASPYAAFALDSDYAEPTLPLEAAGATEHSYASGTTLDHIVLSRALGARVVPGSVDVLRTELQARYPDFRERISDHFPVTLTLAW